MSSRITVANIAMAVLALLAGGAARPVNPPITEVNLLQDTGAPVIRPSK